MSSHRFPWLLLMVWLAHCPGAYAQKSWFQPAKPADAASAPAGRSSWVAGLFGNKAAKSAQPAAEPAPGQSKPATPEEKRKGQLAFARIYERRGEFQYAKAIYEAAIKSNRQDPLPHHRLATIAVRENRFAEAEKHFQAALELAPPSTDLLSDLGYAYYLEHRLEEAEQVLRDALRQSPEHPAAAGNLALVCGAQGRYDECLTLFKRVNNDAEAYANLAYVLSQNGELEKAEKTYLYAVTMDKKLRGAAQAMVQVHERRGLEKKVVLTSYQAQEPRPEPRASRPAPEPESAAISTETPHTEADCQARLEAGLRLIRPSNR